METGVLGMGVAFLSSLCWGALDAIRKRLTSRIEPEPLLVLLCFGQVPVFVAWAAVSGAGLPEPAYTWAGMASVVLNVAANLLFLYALKASPLSRTVPFLAFSPAFAALVAWATLGETLSLRQWGGIVMVAGGGYLLASSPGTRIWRAIREEPGSVMMTGVAAIWATTGSIDKWAMRHAEASVHAIVQTVGVGLVMLAWVVARGKAKELLPPRGEKRWIAGLVVAASGALGLQLVALQMIYVGLVEAVKRAVGTLMAFVIGHTAFDERFAPRHLFAMALMIVGGVLLLT